MPKDPRKSVQKTDNAEPETQQWGNKGAEPPTTLVLGGDEPSG